MTPDWPDWWDDQTEPIVQSLDLCSETRIPSGIAALDGRLLGFEVGCIYELTGEAGSGKTNVCLELCKHATKTCFINTMKPVSINRMIDIDSETFYMIDLKTFEEFILFVYSDLKRLAEQKEFTLLVIDNIASIFRDSETTKSLSDLISRFSIVLKHISYTCKFAVVCVNNVVADMNTENAMSPCLGLTWTNSINYRILLVKDDRSFRLVFGNCPPFVLGIVITNKGVEFVEM